MKSAFYLYIELLYYRLPHMQDSLLLLDNFIKQSGGYTGADGQLAWMPALCLIAVQRQPDNTRQGWRRKRPGIVD